MTFSRPKWVFLAAMTISLLTLSRAQLYYGRILHGWDAQFYYSLAQSLALDSDVNITNNLVDSPYSEPFDRDGDGIWEAAPRRTDGRIPTKYPLGMSLLEAPLVGVGYLARNAAEASGIRVTRAIGYSAIEIWIVAVGLLAFYCYG